MIAPENASDKGIEGGVSQGHMGSAERRDDSDIPRVEIHPTKYCDRRKPTQTGFAE